MTGIIVGCRYIPGEKATLVQGVRGNAVPRRALHGSNGTFLVAGDPPKVIVTIQLEDDSIRKENIYYLMKDSGCKRVTENRAAILGLNLAGKQVVIEDGECTNLLDLVKEYIKYSM